MPSAAEVADGMDPGAPLFLQYLLYQRLVKQIFHQGQHIGLADERRTYSSDCHFWSWPDDFDHHLHADQDGKPTRLLKRTEDRVIRNIHMTSHGRDSSSLSVYPGGTYTIYR